MEKNVQKYRLMMKWTQAELAEKIDVSTAFMTHIERGTRGVSMETIEMIARALRLPYTSLFEDLGKTPSDNNRQNQKYLLHTLKDELCHLIGTAIDAHLIDG